jgi:hypothetical protein
MGRDRFVRTIEQLLGQAKYGLFGFRPRPDNVAEGDQQWSFVHNRDRVAIFLKGNAAGGTEAAAYKTALFVLRQQQPPRPDTPFWIISNKYDQCIRVCWLEKLYGHGYIPDCEIQWDRVEWKSEAGRRPASVPLKPWPGRGDANWVLEFKSYGEGREMMQATSIGGFWFSEQFPWPIFTEVFRGCRDYLFPGGQFCEFTPIDPDLCAQIQEILDHPRPGWRIYPGNTRSNAANLAEGWIEDFAATVPQELLETRLRGELAGFEGVIYQSFNRRVHVVEDEHDARLPSSLRGLEAGALRHGRGIDWGESEQHWFVSLWACRDLEDNWLVYDEYSSNDQGRITADHAVEVLARSIAWGWPVPQPVRHPTAKTRYVAEAVLKRLEEMGKGSAQGRAVWKAVRQYLLDEDQATCAATRYTQHHGGMDFADHRPGEIAEFARYGIPCGLASKQDVYAGINCVRELLKVSPFTDRPRLWIAARCKRLIANLAKYRWDEPGGRKRIKASPLKRDDDEPDALRYLLYSAARHGDTAVPGSLDHHAVRGGRRRSIQYVSKRD